MQVLLEFQIEYCTKIYQPAPVEVSNCLDDPLEIHRSPNENLKEMWKNVGRKEMKRNISRRKKRRMFDSITTKIRTSG